uniref:hypothetical protein n=1 Tax=Agathobacter sp. TaxID=2021311 RepID=UPI00405625FF
MKILTYECRKILNLRLLIFLIVFTGLFYNMFMGIMMHPDDNAECVAGNDFAATLREEYGYDTILPYEDFGVLEEIRQKQFAKLDVLVQESSVLREEGITSYQELEAMDHQEMRENVYGELIRIDFEDGTRQVFLKQHIASIYESMEFHPTLGIAKGKEPEAADTFLSHATADGYTRDAVKRVADVIAQNRLSLLPNSAVFHLEMDFPKFGVLLIISCLVFILPYQIREHLAGGNVLFAATNMGRNLWNIRYLSAVISCFGVCLAQFFVFCIALAKAGILQYWSYPANGNMDDFYWMDMNLGTCLILKGILYSVIALSTMTVFYLISRLAQNYIVGIAIGIPATVGFGFFTVWFTDGFMDVRLSIENDLLRPIGFAAVLAGIAAAIVCGLRYWDKRRDILE